jgi:hypothetical protein
MMAPNMIEITLNKVKSPYVWVKVRSKDFVINHLTNQPHRHRYLNLQTLSIRFQVLYHPP